MFPARKIVYQRVDLCPPPHPLPFFHLGVKVGFSLHSSHACKWLLKCAGWWKSGFLQIWSAHVLLKRRFLELCGHSDTGLATLSSPMEIKPCFFLWNSLKSCQFVCSEMRFDSHRYQCLSWGPWNIKLKCIKQGSSALDLFDLALLWEDVGTITWLYFPIAFLFLLLSQSPSVAWYVP